MPKMDRIVLWAKMFIFMEQQQKRKNFDILENILRQIQTPE